MGERREAGSQAGHTGKDGDVTADMRLTHRPQQGYL